MNIMILEDDPSAMSVISYLQERGYNVWHAQSLLDVAYFLEEDPGLDHFDKLMFDAAVLSESLSFMGKEKINYGAKDGFSGLEFVVENFDLLKKKSIAIITAYNREIHEKMKNTQSGKIIDKLEIIDKSDDKFMGQLLNFLNSDEVDYV